MTWMVMLTQIVLPILLLVWLAVFPASGWLALGIQLISVAAVLLGIGLAALWTMPPYWVPYVYAMLFVIIAVRHLLRGGPRDKGIHQPSVVHTVVIVVVSGLGLAGAFLAYQALQGRVLPEEEVVDIAPPFSPGYYLVAHGGSTEMVNIHLMTLDQTVKRYEPWRGQSKALDIFRITPLGLHKDGWQPTDPARYMTFDVPVVSPCRGEVALVLDGIEDMPVPQMDREHMAGNHVVVDCGGFVVILGHLRQGSIEVATGDQVAVGNPLARMGNSGNTSEPHLHVHAQRGLPEEAPLGGEPLWLTINGRFLVRNSILHVLAEESR